MKSKTVAAILAFLFGGLGAHKFYLGEFGKGLFYLMFCWTGIPYLAGVIEGVIYLTMSDHNFNLKYNNHLFYQQVPNAIPANFGATNNAQSQTNNQAQNVTINLGSELKEQLAAKQITQESNYIEEIKQLNLLRQQGILTEEEFTRKKQDLLD